LTEKRKEKDVLSLRHIKAIKRGNKEWKEDNEEVQYMILILVSVLTGGLVTLVVCTDSIVTML
jgi:hypothetical protein